MALQHYINHISLVVDKSGSMSSHSNNVVKVFDKELEYLKQRSIELDQETRISIYLFDTQVECLTFDMDVMRFKTLAGHYRIGNQTALIDAVLRSTADNAQLPQLYGDHAFLQYVITDGMENASKKKPTDLHKAFDILPENWTLACLVPDQKGKFEAKKFGFTDDSISIWDTTQSNAIEKVGQQFSRVMDNYMTMRSSGVRGTKGLFTLDTKGLSKSALKEVPTTQYQVFPVHKDSPIREYVESWTQEPYRLGSAYYQPTKTVKIQEYKNLLVQDVKNGRVYEGQNLRQLLGLPEASAEVDPGSHKDWRILVQSTSTNRKLFGGTFVLVRK
jgi:hypothetical protein